MLSDRVENDDRALTAGFVRSDAEMERMERDAPHRVWPLEERTLNLWGTAWMRA